MASSSLAQPQAQLLQQQPGETASEKGSQNASVVAAIPRSGSDVSQASVVDQPGKQQPLQPFQGPVPLCPEVPAEVVGAPSPGGSLKLGRCVFDCGPPRPYTQLTNTATSKYPRWMCGPCNQARRALEAQGRTDKAWGKRIADLKKEDPEECNASIRSIRVISSDDAAGAPGVRDLAARGAMIIRMAKAFTQGTEIRETVNLAWKDKRAYAAYLKYTRGEKGIDLEDDDCVNRVFEEALQNPDIQRRAAPGGGFQVQVDMGDTIQGSRFEGPLRS